MDLTTTYMGMTLPTPLVASAGPLAQSVDKVKQMAESGISAVVMWSLFEEQISHDRKELDYYLEHGADRFAESLTYFPEIEEFRFGADQYFDQIKRLKDSVDIPVIASLNGISAGGWIGCAKKMQSAGADGVELNVYYIPTSMALTSDRIESVYLAILEAVKQAVSIPVAVKLSPYFSATANILQKLDAAGADALVLFNRFYQPDLDIYDLSVKPSLKLSTSDELRLPLRWTAILHGRVQASLAVSTGVHTPEDVAKCLLAGGDVAMMTSALLKNGPRHGATLKQGLIDYMTDKGYESVSQMKGVLSQSRCAEPAAFERANYMKMLASFGPTPTFE